MTYDNFLGEVKKRTSLRNQMETSAAVSATLYTLAERLPPEERENLAAQLPLNLKKLIYVEGAAQKFSLDDFFNRVSERMETDRERAEMVSDEILKILSESISTGEIDDLKENVPVEFYELFEK